MTAPVERERVVAHAHLVVHFLSPARDLVFSGENYTIDSRSELGELEEPLRGHGEDGRPFLKREQVAFVDVSAREGG